MARIRSIKPEFWTDEAMADLPRDVRLLFIGLWNHADDEGRFVDNALLIKAAVFPLDEDIDAATIRRWLDELSSRARIVRYEVSGKRYAQVANWQHQKIDRPQRSKLPGPDEADETPGQDTFDDDSTNDRRTLADASSSGSGIRDQGSGSSPIDTIGAHELESAPSFDEFWLRYPRRNGIRAGKQPAATKWKRMSVKDRQAALDGVDAYAARAGDFPVDAERYLKRQLWLDDDGAVTAGATVVSIVGPCRCGFDGAKGDPEHEAHHRAYIESLAEEG